MALHGSRSRSRITVVSVNNGLQWSIVYRHCVMSYCRSRVCVCVCVRVRVCEL